MSTFITEEFVLSPQYEQRFRAKVQPRLDNGTLFGMGVISEVTYYRTYSRIKKDGQQEGWCDTILRVTNGIGSILKTHFISHRLQWDESHWQDQLYKLAKYMGLLRMLPPGRGLWAMGTELIKQRGAMFLYNCGAATSRNLVEAVNWIMDALMCGTGVGSDMEWDGVARAPLSTPTEMWVVEDSREGWVSSVTRLLNCWIPDRGGQTQGPVEFDYSQVRPLGQPLKTFGGIASGPQPLIDLHNRIRRVMSDYMNQKISRTRCCADVINAVGACVVAGNVRRSAEIFLGSPDDIDFINLKNSAVHPDRADIAWLSNNSVVLTQSEQFTRHVAAISNLIQLNGEPGIVNLINVQNMGRMGEHHPDKATLMNPCVTGDVWVKTSEGLRQVRDLIGKQFIAICDGKQYTSTDRGFWMTHENASVFQLETAEGKVVKMTANHQLVSATAEEYGRGSVSRWKELKDIKVGDYVRVHNHETCFLRFERVVSINYVGVESVYDCTIPGCGYFDGNGVVLHNCSEIPLESFEVCNLAEVFPNRCTPEQFPKAIDMATFYTTVVTLLPTHRPETNVVVARNRRIGVSLSGLATWKDRVGATVVTRMCRDGYHFAVSANRYYARLFGIPPSIRVTTVKPSGTISLLAGETPGMHYPSHTRFIRRMIVSLSNPVFNVLVDAGYPYEHQIVDPGHPGDENRPARPRKYDMNSAVFEFPGKYNCERACTEVTMWEQFAFLAQLQREWADNSVSVTITFDKEREGSQIEHALGMYLPLIKSVSMLPHSPAGAYLQMPYEGITEEEYQRRIRQVRPLRWSLLQKSDGMQERFCTNDACAL